MNAGELRRLKDACTQRPRDAQAWAQFGVASKQHGQLSEAIRAYRTSLQLKPTQARTWANLARALREQGDLPGAIDAFRSAVALDATFAEGESMLSNALREHRQYDEALNAARRAIVIKPELAEAHLNEGVALHALGRLREAVVSYLVSLVLAPSQAAHGNLDKALATLTQKPVTPDVEVVARLRREPHDASALRELGVLLISQDRLHGAGILLAKSHELTPSADVMFLRAFVERRKGNDGQAEQHLRAGLTLDPAHQGCLDALGAVLVLSGRLSEARTILERAIHEQPDTPELLLNYANVCREFSEHAQSAALCKQAEALAPQRPEFSSVSLFGMHFEPSASPDAIREAHLAYGRRFAETPRFAHANTRDAERTLRIGYVSPDLRTHPVAHFLEPVLRAHDKQRVSVHVYADVSEPDVTTRRLQKLVPHWRDTARLSHGELAKAIQDDGIDILVDLAGHSAGNRLPAFALKPAPVQVSWLGYFDTTGMSQIDYRVTDALAVPPSEERAFSEELVRLPRSANCFQPIAGAPAVSPAPCLKSGHVTYGCFSQPSKINRDVVRAFAAILRRVPNSRLVLKYTSFKDAGLREHTKRWFVEEHIDAERITFRGHSPLDMYAQAFAEVDVALDPFPYGGETTALHGLWMGVPMVALEGSTLSRRLAARVLRTVGLDAWVARSEAEYVDLAVKAADDLSDLATLRAKLRERLAQSPLLDHAGVTRELEDAYRTMWRRFCAAG